jgi:NAD(P)-dependent dehydrogenase (short-subunit alcohol dehydrogenase family)
MAVTSLRTYQNAVAIITGGASGIGRALAEELARQGAEVVLADLQVELAEEVAAKIGSVGGKARAVGLDVRDFDAVQALVGQVAGSAGRLDYLFNNAGIVVGGEAQHYEIEDWNRVIDVNLRGVVNGVQAAYVLMRRQGFGHIVNTASMAGLVPLSGFLSYSASKHAVVGLSTCLRVEAAPVGVRVSVLCPGAVETPIVGGGKFGKSLHPPPPEVMRQLWEKGRPISPERFVREALAAVAKNRAIIVIPWWWKFVWWTYRLSPTLALALALARKHFLSVKRAIQESRVEP